MMKRQIITAAIFFGTILTAHASEIDVWNDIRNPWRSNAEMQGAVKADARACNREVGVQRGPLTAAFKQCMLRHDWQFGYAKPKPSSPPKSSLPVFVRNSDGTSFDSSNNDAVRVQRDQDNTQQMINNQQSFDNQQRMNDEQAAAAARAYRSRRRPDLPSRVSDA